eukprot:c2652_g1_i1.p1 GENE.c2652_g1_i1~~c2652_g1_i1.p1  ORF type:complete len:317 (-),score=69.05 c2652_g1_i1:172-1122(-)
MDRQPTTTDEVALKAQVKTKHTSHRIPKWSDRELAITGEGEIWFSKEGRMKEVAMLVGCAVSIHPTEQNCLVLAPYRQGDIFIRFDAAEEVSVWHEKIRVYSLIPVNLDASGPEDLVLSKFGRLKKTLASKASGTSAGRKVILGAFGEAGLGVVEALTAFAEEVDCHETSDMVMINALRLAVKIGVLLEDGVLKPQQFRALLPLADEAVPFFSPEKFSFAPSIAPKQLEVLLRSSKQSVESVLAPHVTPTSLSRLAAVFDVYTREERLVQIQQSPVLVKQREMLVAGLMRFNQAIFRKNEFRASLITIQPGQLDDD